MRWLLLKDLQILRRSPLLVALLVAYPVAVSVLIGLVLSGGPDKPRVAFANLVPAGEDSVSLGGQRLDAARFSAELFESIEPVRVDSRAEAVDKVRSGEALGALVVPEDLPGRLQATLGLGGGAAPAVEVIYNAEDPVKRRFVQAAIESRLADANRALSAELTAIAADYLRIIVAGGSISLLGQEFEVLGLRRSGIVLRAAIASLPPGAPERNALEQVVRFARLAADNLDVSRPILASIGEPVRVEQTVLDGGRTPLDAFAVAVSVTVSGMFVTLLLASGMLALEREEHALARLLRGLVSRERLLAEKALLAAGCSLAVTALMLAGLGLFVDLDWARAPSAVLALAAAAVGFGAMGVAIGALAREVRAASLLAFLLTLPVALIALVPSGAVSPALFDAASAVSAAFPFAPALDALDAALNGGSLAAPVAHLAALSLVFGLLARGLLRRLA